MKQQTFMRRDVPVDGANTTHVEFWRTEYDDSKVLLSLSEFTAMGSPELLSVTITAKRKKT